MTTNLSSFLRHKYSGKGPVAANEEQDLGGFDGGGLRGTDLPAIKFGFVMPGMLLM
jgi:hypothetical protein